MFRCELCDTYLPILSSGRLCETCYKIRLITKCYSAESIHKYIANMFLVDIDTNSEITENLTEKEKKDLTEDDTYEKPTEELKENIKSIVGELKKRSNNNKKK